MSVINPVKSKDDFTGFFSTQNSITSPSDSITSVNFKKILPSIQILLRRHIDRSKNINHEKNTWITTNGSIYNKISLELTEVVL